jgi:hypothetical protein
VGVGGYAATRAEKPTIYATTFELIRVTQGARGALGRLLELNWKKALASHRDVRVLLEPLR